MKELKERNKEREALEAEIDSLRKEVKSGKILQNYAKSSNNLDELISNQRSCSDKTGLDYNEIFERESSSSLTTKEGGYAKSTKQVDLRARSRDQDSKEEPWKTIPRRRFPFRYQPIFNGYCFSCVNYGHMAKDCKFIDMYNYQGPSHPNEPFTYAHLFNGYCFLCANYGHMARDYEVFDRCNRYLQNPRSNFTRSRDRFHDDFLRRECVLDGLNIECFKHHKYGHSARYCRYKMESPMEKFECFKCHNYGHMARDCRNTKVWKRKQVLEDKEDNKVSAVMLLGFVKAKGHEELAVASDNDSSQNGLLGESLF